MGVIDEAVRRGLQQAQSDISAAKAAAGRYAGMIETLRDVVLANKWGIEEAIRRGTESVPASEVAALLQLLWDVSSGFPAPKGQASDSARNTGEGSR